MAGGVGFRVFFFLCGEYRTICCVVFVCLLLATAGGTRTACGMGTDTSTAHASGSVVVVVTVAADTSTAHAGRSVRGRYSSSTSTAGTSVTTMVLPLCRKSTAGGTAATSSTDTTGRVEGVHTTTAQTVRSMSGHTAVVAATTSTSRRMTTSSRSTTITTLLGQSTSTKSRSRGKSTGTNGGTDHTDHTNLRLESRASGKKQAKKKNGMRNANGTST